jgi:hypothetical protein
MKLHFLFLTLLIYFKSHGQRQIPKLTQIEKEAKASLIVNSFFDKGMLQFKKTALVINSIYDKHFGLSFSPSFMNNTTIKFDFAPHEYIDFVHLEDNITILQHNEIFQNSIALNSQNKKQFKISFSINL